MRSSVLFFDGFRCGVWLYSVFLVRYNNRKLVKMDVYVRPAGDHFMGNNCSPGCRW